MIHLHEALSKSIINKLKQPENCIITGLGKIYRKLEKNFKENRINQEEFTRPYFLVPLEIAKEYIRKYVGFFSSSDVALFELADKYKYASLDEIKKAYKDGDIVIRKTEYGDNEYCGEETECGGSYWDNKNLKNVKIIQ